VNTIELLKPALQGGIDRVNFFNGRLLSAEDLKLQEDANQDHHRRIGKAIGPGVAWGLEVYKSDNAGVDNPIVKVLKGCAINRSGQTVELSQDVEVNLRSTGAAATASDVTELPAFGPCSPITSDSIRGVDRGVYLLSLAPASRGKGQAPVSWIDNGPAPCATKYSVETVKFNLVQVNVDVARFDDEKKLRNYLAYACSDMEKYRTVSVDPFSDADLPANLIDTLRPAPLTDDLVPLAIIFWKEKEGIVFVDRWAVRRRLSSPASGAWDMLIGNARTAEAEALLFQFQEQIREIGDTLTYREKWIFEAQQWFRWLPPAGIIPWAGMDLNDTGFSYDYFFKPLAFRAPVFINEARVAHLFEESLRFPPIDINEGELVWLYRIRENQQLHTASTSNLPQLTLVFAGGHIGWYGDARYDVCRWNYGNYSSEYT